MMLTGLGNLTSDIAAAIAQMEGAGTRNNNPGNLTALPSYTYPGQVGVDSRGFAIFDSMASGQAQLARQVDLNISRGLSTEQFFCGAPGIYAGYAPDAGGNNCQGYAAFVAGQIGIDPSVPLNQADMGSSDWVDAAGDGSGTAETGLFSGSNTTILLAGAAVLVGAWIFSRN